jgi:hypothetical protein
MSGHSPRAAGAHTGDQLLAGQLDTTGLAGVNSAAAGAGRFIVLCFMGELESGCKHFRAAPRGFTGTNTVPL